MKKSTKIELAIFIMGLLAGIVLKDKWFSGSYKAYIIVYLMVAACSYASIVLVKTKKKRKGIKDEYVQPRKMTLK